MSSYIVEEKTIDRILSFLRDRSTGTIDNSMVKTWVSKLQLSDLFDNKKMTAFGKKLYKLNLKAVIERYDKKHGFELAKYIFNYRLEKIEQAYNSLRCFTYQCSEGNVPKTKLFKQMEELEMIVARMIADREADKIKAEWS